MSISEREYSETGKEHRHEHLESLRTFRFGVCFIMFSGKFSMLLPLKLSSLKQGAPANNMSAQ
jgi:hypothetical protein